MRLNDRYVLQGIDSSTVVLVDDSTAQEATLKLDPDSVSQILDHIRQHQLNGGPIPIVDTDGGAILMPADLGTTLAFSLGYFYALLPASERS